MADYLTGKDTSSSSLSLGKSTESTRGTESGILRVLASSALSASSKAADAASNRYPRTGLSAAKIMNAIWHRRWLALAFGLLFAALGVTLAWLFDKPKYTAAAIVQISHASSILPGSAEDRGRQEELRKTHTQLIKTRRTINAALKHERVRGLDIVRAQEDPHAWLEKDLQAGFITGTDLLRISLTGSDPHEVATIVNVVKDVYLEEVVETDKKQQFRRLDEIEKICVNAEEKVRTQRDDLRRLAETLKTADSQALTLLQKAAVDEFSTVRREFLGIESELRQVQSLVLVSQNILKAAEAFQLPEKAIDDAVERDPAVQKQQLLVRAIETAIDDYRRAVLVETPKLATYQDDLKAQTKALAKIRTDRRPQVADALRREARKKAEVDFADAQFKASVLVQRRDVVEKEVVKARKIADQIGTSSFELELRRSDIDQANAVLKRLRDEKERLLIETQYTRLNAREQQVAETPKINQAPLIKTASTYSVFGLLIGLFGVGYLEARSRRIQGPADIRHEMGLETLAVIPQADGSGVTHYGRNLADPKQDHWLVESVDNLRTVLMCANHLGPKPVIMVTSGSANEGKTFVACQLVSSFARTGRKCLIVDCDFRKPACHTFFGLPAGPGLSEVLQGKIKLKDAVRTIEGSAVSILTAGDPDENVIQSLSNGAFQEVLFELRDSFDCIILDSAPTLMVSDGLLVGKHADGVILVARPHVSRSPVTYSAYEQMKSIKIPILGVVVNGMLCKSPGEYYTRY